MATKLKDKLKNLFQHDEEQIVYKDYETDPNEDMDITPEYLKERTVLNDNLEEIMRMNKRFKKIYLKRG